MLELAAPVWHSGVTVAASKQLERVQKAAFSIILGKQYLTDLKMESLKERRKHLCSKFAKKAQKVK